MRMKQKTFNGGQSLVEFALILPIVMLFLMVILDLGRAVYSYSAIHNAAREGARYGAVNWDDDMRTTHIKDAVERLTAGLHANSITINYKDQDGDGKDDVVEVIVTYKFIPSTPILAYLLGPSGSNGLDLPGRAVMRLER